MSARAFSSVHRFQQPEHFLFRHRPVDHSHVCEFACNGSHDLSQLLARHAGLPQGLRHVELRDELCSAVRAGQRCRLRIVRVERNFVASRERKSLNDPHKFGTDFGSDNAPEHSAAIVSHHCISAIHLE
jgi:hypothetical protein